MPDGRWAEAKTQLESLSINIGCSLPRFTPKRRLLETCSIICARNTICFYSAALCLQDESRNSSYLISSVVWYTVSRWISLACLYAKSEADFSLPLITGVSNVLFYSQYIFSQYIRKSCIFISFPERKPSLFWINCLTHWNLYALYPLSTNVFPSHMPLTAHLQYPHVRGRWVRAGGTSRAHQAQSITRWQEPLEHGGASVEPQVRMYWLGCVSFYLI